MKGINKLEKLFKKYLELNKRIVDEYSVAVVPAKRISGMPVSDLDVEEDFIYFCFTKFTKSMIAINELINKGLYEDALILSRSNYECFINAKAVIKTEGMIEHLVEYRLGLIDEKRYKRLKNSNKNSKIIKVDEPHEQIDYIGTVGGIADKAHESNSYKYIYSYLCDITHLNMITSAYYRDGSRYSYSLKSDIAYFNALLWSVYFCIKFYNTLLESEIIDHDEFNEFIASVLINDSIELQEVFEDEKNRIRNYLDDAKEDKSLSKYIEFIDQLKKEIGK